MFTNQQVKQIVKEQYGKIAERRSNGCGCGCGSPKDTDFSEDYSKLEGYVAEADLGLGCGIPTEFAAIKTGDTVLDLGAGAGNDVFVARSLVGETGRVIGVDMTESMIKRAEQNKAKLGFQNVEFRLGDIENLPVDDASIDVTVSNCVLNLVPDKAKAFSEIFRTLKPGGHFCISDVVLEGELPGYIKANPEALSACVSGAWAKDAYLNLVRATGFTNIVVKSERRVGLEPELIENILSDSDMDPAEAENVSVLSITVVGEKPSL
jgi:ubiquinone/menaquinone biosynthesis C-methylase UbiE